MKKICENQYQMHGSCFTNISWTPCTSDTELSIGEMFAEFMDRQANHAEMKKK